MTRQGEQNLQVLVLYALHLKLSTNRTRNHDEAEQGSRLDPEPWGGSGQRRNWIWSETIISDSGELLWAGSNICSSHFIAGWIKHVVLVLQLQTGTEDSLKVQTVSSKFCLLYSWCWRTGSGVGLWILHVQPTTHLRPVLLLSLPVGSVLPDHKHKHLPIQLIQAFSKILSRIYEY